ncbi:uncharacterized protein LOC133118841 [Conger conger]|uniref:uncharacterized protein LOC133118841 n=1 Tax=Conger conger TaxID=82655 RepID=UPI002A59AFF0|nr:uncharacterized protein LOC133118841 [Conger conger]
MHYGKLEEFVTLVTEAVPGLSTCRQRAQLIQDDWGEFGTRKAREGSRQNEDLREVPLADPQIIQAHVDRLQSYSAPCSPAGVNDAEAEVSEANFLELVQTLLKDPAQREHFFQDVFPVQFGLKYDATLQVLVWEFLSRLELLLPVPDLTQTASLLSAAAAGLEECMQCASHQQQLKTLLQHHKCFGQLTTNTLPSIDDCVVPSSWRRMGRVRGKMSRDLRGTWDSAERGRRRVRETNSSTRPKLEQLTPRPGCGPGRRRLSRGTRRLGTTW